MSVDILALGAHPDDIELSCGGTLAKLKKLGRSIALIDITEGELGTRGTKEMRQKEAEEAAKILGAVTRRNLKIPDGNIEVNQDNRLKLIQLIRELQPKVMLIPYSVDRHPDHGRAHLLCKESWFYAGLQKIRTTLNGQTQHAYRPDRYYEYMQWHQVTPTFIVDISDVMDVKMNAIRAHRSQFHDPESKDPETVLSRPDFLDSVENRARYYGRRIGVQYGEPFYSLFPLGVSDLFHLVQWKG
ncbi:MAG TPA: bacillithiol biosynthesis deacetylase BshB1 [Bacteroidota bacterium]|nr:bacillithiol biosynthesis deacetylase BshB1 [Bacteroidota bacterium]